MNAVTRGPGNSSGLGNFFARALQRAAVSVTLRREGADRTYFMARYLDTHFLITTTARPGEFTGAAVAARNMGSAFARRDTR
jgi:hypothetical protein